MWPNPQETEDLVTFTDEILNGKLYFFLQWKVEVTQSKSLTLLSKETWEYLLDKGITITAKYPPGSVSKEADFQSRSVKDSIEWKLNPEVFQMICKQWETPNLDLFALKFHTRFQFTWTGNWIQSAREGMLFKVHGLAWEGMPFLYFH